MTFEEFKNQIKNFDLSKSFSYLEEKGGIYFAKPKPYRSKGNLQISYSTHSALWVVTDFPKCAEGKTLQKAYDAFQQKTRES